MPETVFSLAVLSVMVTIALKMTGAVTAAFAAKYAATLGKIGSADGISSMALQQGSLGLLLSTLIAMAPPMAAAFFQGTLGNFASYNSFSSIGAGGGFAARQQAMASGQQPAPPSGDCARGGEAPRGQTEATRPEPAPIHPNCHGATHGRRVPPRHLG